jgi:hypothetical protein
MLVAKGGDVLIVSRMNLTIVFKQRLPDLSPIKQYLAGDIMKTFQLLRQSLVLATIVFAGTVAHSQDGISKTAIVIGQSVALSGPSAALGAPFAQGARLY